MEAILKYYLEDGHIEEISNYTKDTNEKERIIYEVFRVSNGVPLFYEDHIKRLESSFKLSNKVFSYKYDKIREYILRLIKENSMKFGNIKLTFDVKTDTMKIIAIKHSYPTEEMYEKGVNTIFYHGERKNPNVKVVDSTFRKRVTEEINKNNAFEAILVNNSGYITEGSKSNIFMIKDEILYTSPIEDVLPGVTRGRIIGTSKQNNIKFEEKNIKYQDIEKYDALFISGTSPNILPIAKVNDIEFDIHNEVMRNLMNKFNDDMEKYTKNFQN
ncbi:aminotransferase class IV [Clostridium sp.]|uniref:aminotransferase class IV n=1 Tax=Clostridium sp. TaxID=1506 RepID=UPI002606AF0C|nr:aminotransferase class IV [Clostridium sp.]